MSLQRSSRRLLVVSLAGALAAAGLAVASPASAAPAATTGQGPTTVTDATFTWGLSGYAQKGVFGPWTFKDVTGNASVLTGSVSGGSQTSYAVDPVPATSMPASSPQKTPNAVRFTNGKGSVDASTGAGTLSFTGSYTVNAYPPQFNAPNEVYTDPQVKVNTDGSGTLTAAFTIGAGTDQNGNAFPAKDFGRLTLANYDAGSLSARTSTGYRVTADYQGISNGQADQTTSCSTSGGATGWWGSWPTGFVTALKSHAAGQSVLPHFYSTGCGGNQDLKPPLPFDVSFHAAAAPQVTVSETNASADGQTTVTVTGTKFDPTLATGTRPPLSGKPAGTYIVFGKFAPNWRPSQGAPSSVRKVFPSAQKWAVRAADMATIGGPSAGAVELSENGSFTTELTLDKAALDAIATDPALTNYGIYTYPGSGGTAPAYETYTPVTFGPPPFGAPSGLKVTERTATSLTLGWSKVQGAVKYRVSYGIGTGYRTRIEVKDVNALTIPRLKPGTTYSVDIAAVDAKSKQSALSARIPAATEALTAPTGLHVTGKTASSITLGWDKVAGTTKYSVTYGAATGARTTVRLGDVATATVARLKPGVVYTFDVAAVTAASAVSPYSPRISAAPDALTPPTEFRATGLTTTSVTFLWNKVPGATKYRITYQASGATAVTARDVADVSTLKVYGLKKGTSYAASIVAITPDGSKSTTAQTSFTTP